MSTGSNGQNSADVDRSNFIDDIVDLCYDSDVDILYESESSNDCDDAIGETTTDNRTEKLASTSTHNQAASEPQHKLRDQNEKTDSTISKPVQNEACIDIMNEFHNNSEENIISSIMARLTWLSSSAISYMQDGDLTLPDPKDIYSLSCALWFSQELAFSDKISALLTHDKFDLFLEWSLRFLPTSVIKLALDRVLCSMYALKPDMFPDLLEKFNIILPTQINMHTESNSKMPHCFVHVCATNIICHPYESRHLSTIGCLLMTKNKYCTLAQISQSRIAALQLIHSGYLALLVDLIIQFCATAISPKELTVKKSTSFEVRTNRIDDVILIMRFLSDLCEEGSIRTWLASDDIRIFWDALFEFLCYEQLELPNINVDLLKELADTTITFLSKCCQCYPANLEKLANVIINNLPKIVKRDQRNIVKISAFGRKIFSELITATEYVFVSVEICLDRTINFVWNKEKTVPFLPPPNYAQSDKQRFMHLETNCTGCDIIEKILQQSTKSENLKHIDKRMKLEDTENKTPKLFLWDHKNQRFINVEQNLTIAQMLTILLNNRNTLEDPVIKFLLTEKEEESATEASFYDVFPFSFLKILTDVNIFEKIYAQVPQVHKLPQHARTTFNVYHVRAGSPTQQDQQFPQLHEWSSMPLFSLVIHGQCLRLTEYREEIERRPFLQPITCKGSALYVDIARSKVLFSCDPQKLVNPLATLPLELLRFCFKSADNEKGIRKAAVKHGIVDLIFASLAIFTHNANIVEEDYIQNQHVMLIKCLKQCQSNVTVQYGECKQEEKGTKQYWPKGVGYGSNSDYTSVSNRDHSNLKRRLKTEEDYVTIIFQVLASFIQPDFRLYDLYQNYMNEICDLELGTCPNLPTEFLDLLERSCLLPVLVDYLRNDSILDIVRHIPLYTAILQLLRCMASNTQTVKFILSHSHVSAQCSTSSATKFTSIQELLNTMKTHADIYSANCLDKTTSCFLLNPEFNLEKMDADEEALIGDISITAIIINIIKQKLSATFGLYSSDANVTKSKAEVEISDEEKYIDVMGKLRFESYEIISENTGPQLTFNVAYAYCSEVNVDNATAVGHPARIRRIAQEISTLSTSLPVTYSSSVFVRCDTDRLDIMKVLITGPANTPYMNGCFEFDVYFPCTYPNTPMQVKLVTTGRNRVRFNPNLYANGKVCLSLLNTWQGTPDETWNPQTSSLIQVLISIQALILVPDPYFNEPGYQSSRGTNHGTLASKRYNSKLLPLTIKWAMLEQLRKPNPCFREVINAHFWLKKNEIGEQVSEWLKEETDAKNKAAIQRHYEELQVEFSKLQPPAGMTD